VIRQSVTGRQLKSVPLRRDHFVMAMPKSHRLAVAGKPGPEPVSLADFRDDPWVWLPRHISPDCHDELVAACRGRQALAPRRTTVPTPSIPCSRWSNAGWV
jgi:DNA-binding transcriptional LysR family regulator